MLGNYLNSSVRRQALILSLLAWLVSESPLFAIVGSTVSLAWDPSGDNTVAGYNVYYGTSSRTYTNIIPVGSSTSAIVSNLATGVTYYFAATTYTTDGMESEYSDEAAYAAFQPNVPPTLDAVSDCTIPENAAEQTIKLTGITTGDTNEVQTLNVSAFSSNPGLIPNPTVNYSSPEASGTLTFAPAPASFGSTIITVMVDDGGAVSNTVIRYFQVTVVPPNSPPTIDLLNDLVVNENCGPQMINLTGISCGSTNTTAILTVTATSSNPDLVPNPSVVYTNASNTGTLVLAPLTNMYGTATITVTVHDDQPTNNATSLSFRLTVSQTVFPVGMLTNATILPTTTFRYTIPSPGGGASKFNINLAPGAPAGMKLMTRRGVNWLVWTPSLSQSSTTNLVGLSFTSTTDPASNTNETVQVIVLDYLALAVGSTAISAGQSGSVPLSLSSSEGVTNLSFTMPWPTNSLLNPTLSISAAGVASSSLKSLGNSLVVALQMLPGQSLQGSNVIGSITFQSLSTAAFSYVNLPVSGLTGYKPVGLTYVASFPTAGQVALVSNLAMLQATAVNGSGRNLTILGKVGNTYQVQYTTNLGPASIWTPLQTYNQTSVSQTISLDPAIPQAFYRVQQK